MQRYRNPHPKTKKILAYRFAHPDATVWDVAFALSIKYSIAYSALHEYEALDGDLSHLKDLIVGHEWQKPYVPDLVEQAKIEPPTVKETPMPTMSKILESIRDEAVEVNLTKDEEIAELKSDKLMLETLADAYAKQTRKLNSIIEYLEGKLGIDEYLESTRN